MANTIAAHKPVTLPDTIKDLLKPKSVSMATVPKMNGQDISKNYDVLVETQTKQRGEIAAKIDLQNSKLDELKKFFSLINTLNASTYDLRGAGYLNQSSGVFSEMGVSVTSGDSTIAQIDANGEAQAQTLDISVIQLASRDRITSIEGIANITTPLGIEGDLVIQGTTFTLDTSISLQNLKELINSNRDTGVTAQILPNAQGEFVLSFSAISTGTPITVDSSGLVLNGNPDPTPPTSIRTTQELSARVSFNGQPELSYPTNIVTNVGDGLTLTLTKAGEATYTIAPDVEKIGIAMTAFVQAYNDVARYTREGEADASLKRQSRSALYNVMNQMQGGNANDLKSLSEVGITFKEGYLIFEEKWLTTLQNNPEAIRKVFDFSWTSSDPRSSLISKPENMNESIFQHPLNVQVTNISGTNTATATLNGQVYNLTINSQDPNILQGMDDTPLAGFSFSHLMPIGSTAIYTFSQGVGSQLLQSLDPIINSNGSFTNIQNKYTDGIDKINKQLQIFDEKSEIEKEKFRIDLTKLGQILMYAEMIKLQIESMFSIKG